MSHHKPDPDKNVSLTIDGIPVTVPEGTRIIDAARTINVRIPTLCEHPDLCKRAICRLCVVECDGRGKLTAACANDVWEGVNIVTHNPRILKIRKTIIELLLANHPHECLSCIRNGNCELQSLAEEFGIYAPVFHHDAENRKPSVTESKTLVRDMGKCVKCGRCVEICQEVQTIRSINSSCRSIRYGIGTPYNRALADGPCVFCGQCAVVCPVGAIYEYEQSAEVWAALNDKELHTVVQFSPSLVPAFNRALGLPAGSVTSGKMVSALKHLGFARVFDAGVFAAAAQAEENRELSNRIKNGGPQTSSKLPMIAVCSSGGIKFVEESYPDLADRLSPCSNAGQLFGRLMQSDCSGRITTVSVTPCIANKYRYRQTAHDPDLVLSVNELALLLRQGGIIFAGLPETPFNTMEAVQEAPPMTEEFAAKTLTVYGFANARTVLDSIRRGECDAACVKIMSCPENQRSMC